MPMPWSEAELGRLHAPDVLARANEKIDALEGSLEDATRRASPPAQPVPEIAWPTADELKPWRQPSSSVAAAASSFVTPSPASTVADGATTASGDDASPWGGSLLDVLNSADFDAALRPWRSKQRQPGPTTPRPAAASGTPSAMPTARRFLSDGSEVGSINIGQAGTRASRYAPQIARVSREEGVPEGVLAAIIDTEDSDENSTSVDGARGLTQVVPGQGFDLPGEDAGDPLTSIRQSARALKEKNRMAGGDWRRAGGLYFGVGADSNGVTSDVYQQRFDANRARYGQAPGSQVASGSGTGQAAGRPEDVPSDQQSGGRYSAGSYTPNQIDAATSEGLDYETGLAVCGPAAAIGFARKNGRNPTMQEAVGLARQVGWTSEQGMAGPSSEQKLLQSMGVAARLQDGAPDWQAVAADVQRGNPVIISTPGHYFVAERYDPESGAFDFGNSVAILKAAGGRRWFKPEELPSLGMGEARGSLFMDSPDSPSSSVVAGSSAYKLGAGASVDDGGISVGDQKRAKLARAQGQQPPVQPGQMYRQPLQPTPVPDTTNGSGEPYDPRPYDEGPREGAQTGWPATPASYGDAGDEQQVPVRPRESPLAAPDGPDTQSGGSDASQSAQPPSVPQLLPIYDGDGRKVGYRQESAATPTDPTITDSSYTQPSGRRYDPSDPSTGVNPQAPGSLRPTDLPPGMQGARPWLPATTPAGGIQAPPGVVDGLVPRAAQTGPLPDEPPAPDRWSPQFQSAYANPSYEAAPFQDDQREPAMGARPAPRVPSPYRPGSGNALAGVEGPPPDREILAGQGSAARGIDSASRSLPEQPTEAVTSPEARRAAFQTPQTAGDLWDWRQAVAEGSADAIAQGLGQDPDRVVIGVTVGGVPLQMTVSDLLQNVTDPAFGAGFGVGDMVLDAAGHQALRLVAPYLKGAAKATVGRLLESAPVRQAASAVRQAASDAAGAVGRGARSFAEDAAGRLMDLAPTPRTIQETGAGLASERPPGVGRYTSAFGADPRTVYDLRHRVVDLDDLTPSNLDSGAPNPAFPRELQPRERTRAGSQLQVEQIARDLNPEALLADVHQIDRGSPIVGPDNVVESGNGRTQALRRAADRYPERYQAYVDALRQRLPDYGLGESDLEGIRRPALVRERVSDVDRAAFAAEANRSATLQMSPLERARQDAALLPDAVVGRIAVREGEGIDAALMSSGNRDLVRAYVGALAPNERAALLDPDGGLNAAGLERLKSALLVRTYPGEAGRRIARAFIESTDPGVRVVEHAVYAGLPAMARAEAGIAAGERDAGLSLAGDAAAAVDAYARLRRAGLGVRDYLAQGALFGERELTPTQERILGYLDDNARSPRRIRELLEGYADAVETQASPDQVGMFGAGSRATKEEVLDGVIRGLGRDGDAAADAHPDVGGAGAGGAELARPGGRPAPLPDGAAGGPAGGDGRGPSLADEAARIDGARRDLADVQARRQTLGDGADPVVARALDNEAGRLRRIIDGGPETAAGGAGPPRRPRPPSASSADEPAPLRPYRPDAAAGDIVPRTGGPEGSVAVEGAPRRLSRPGPVPEGLAPRGGAEGTLDNPGRPVPRVAPSDPRIGASTEAVAAEERAGARRGALLNRRPGPERSGLPPTVRAVTALTDDKAAQRWAEDMLTDLAGTPRLAENSIERPSTLARANAGGVAEARVGRTLDPVVEEAQRAGLRDELPQHVADAIQRDYLREVYRAEYGRVLDAQSERIAGTERRGASPAVVERMRAKAQADAEVLAVRALRRSQGDGLAMRYEAVDARLRGQQARLEASGTWGRLQELAGDVSDHNEATRRRLVDAGVIADDPLAFHDWWRRNANHENPLVASRNATLIAERQARKNDAASAFADLYLRATEARLLEGAPGELVASGGRQGPWSGTTPVTFLRDGRRVTLHVAKPVADGIEAAGAMGTNRNAVEGGIRAVIRYFSSLVTTARASFLPVNLARDFQDYAIRTATIEGGPHKLPGVVADWLDQAGKAVVDVASANANARGAVGAVAGGVAGAAQGDGDTTPAERARHAAEGALAGTFLLGANRVAPTRQAAELVARGGEAGGIDAGARAGARWYREIGRQGGVPLTSSREMARFLGDWGADIATLQGIKGVGGRSELVSKAAAMARADRRGLDPTEAMIAGRDATYDPDRAGTLLRALNGYVPFANATVQAGAQVGRLFRQNKVAAATTVMTATAPLVLGLEAWNRSDPDRARVYDDVPQSAKDSGLVMVLPWAGSDSRGERPNWLWIPTGVQTPFVVAMREAAQKLPGLPDAAPRVGVGEDASAVERWGDVLGTALTMFSPLKGDSPGAIAASMVPPVVRQGVEAYTDRDLYTGGPIVSDAADARATAASRSIAGGLNTFGRWVGNDALQDVRPSAVEHTIRAAPAYADLVTGASDLAAPGAAKRAEDRPVANEPFVGGIASRFIRDTGGANLRRAQDDRLPEPVRSVLQEAGMYPSDVQSVPSRWKDGPLTRDEQLAWQSEMNDAVASIDTAVQRNSKWRNPATRDQAVREEIARARDIAARRARLPGESEMQRRIRDGQKVK